MGFKPGFVRWLSNKLNEIQVEFLLHSMEKSLNDLFGSSIKVRILKLLLKNPKESFNIVQIAKITKTSRLEARRHLAGFLKMGLVRKVKHGQKN